MKSISIATLKSDIDDFLSAFDNAESMPTALHERFLVVLLDFFLVKNTLGEQGVTQKLGRDRIQQFSKAFIEISNQFSNVERLYKPDAPCEWEVVP